MQVAVNKQRLVIECLILFGCLPVIMYFMNVTPVAYWPVDPGFEPRRLIFPLLWALALAALTWWKKAHPGQKVFTGISKEEIKRLLPCYLASVMFMGAFLALYEPERFFQFPLERTALWLMVMCFYPLLSVIPQELIYRLFFFDRYRRLFGHDKWMILASGIAFGHAHLLFNNWIAYSMSIAGGIIFSMTYARTKNLTLVWFEHAIYGQAVFTIGLGWYFYSGGAGMAS